MSEHFGPVTVHRKSGAEPFHRNGDPLGFDVLSFWQWSSSDLLSNTMRGILAEYLVARAVGSTDKSRVEWDRYDVISPQGTRIEVKASAYLQSWRQKRPSNIRFEVAEKSGWDAETDTYDAERRRSADIYVFCLLAHQDRATVDPLDVAQWRFFVISAPQLSAQIGVQKSIGLSRLQAIGAVETTYGELAARIDQFGGYQKGE